MYAEQYANDKEYGDGQDALAELRYLPALKQLVEEEGKEDDDDNEWNRLVAQVEDAEVCQFLSCCGEVEVFDALYVAL